MNAIRKESLRKVVPDWIYRAIVLFLLAQCYFGIKELVITMISTKVDVEILKVDDVAHKKLIDANSGLIRQYHDESFMIFVRR